VILHSITKHIKVLATSRKVSKQSAPISGDRSLCESWSISKVSIAFLFTHWVDSRFSHTAFMNRKHILVWEHHADTLCILPQILTGCCQSPARCLQDNALLKTIVHHIVTSTEVFDFCAFHMLPEDIGFVTFDT